MLSACLPIPPCLQSRHLRLSVVLSLWILYRPLIVLSVPINARKMKPSICDWSILPAFFVPTERHRYLVPIKSQRQDHIAYVLPCWEWMATLSLHGVCSWYILVPANVVYDAQKASYVLWVLKVMFLRQRNDYEKIQYYQKFDHQSVKQDHRVLSTSFIVE